MDLNSNLLFWVGYSFFSFYVFSVYLKLHRKKYVIPILIIIALIIAVSGLYITHFITDSSGNKLTTTTFYAPIIYILTYQLLRFLYKKKHHVEPAYEYASPLDSLGKRKLLFEDYVVFILPMITSLLVPIFI